MNSSVERYQPIPWDVLQAQAETLAQSAFVPQTYRGKPNDVLAAGLYGQEIGLGISAALSYIHVINGKPTLSAEGMVALVRSRGHSISGETSATSSTVRGKRADTGDEMTVEWTIDMAKRAGLAGKDTWKQYPEAMLWSRTVSQLCRMLFPDVLLGLSYTPEEARDFDVEVISVTQAPRASSALDAAPATDPTPVAGDSEAPLPPLRAVAQAGPPGRDSVNYYDEDGTLVRHAEVEGEQERRTLISKLLDAKAGLGAPGLKDWDQERINAGISLTKPMRDHTLDELRRLTTIMEGITGGPF